MNLRTVFTNQQILSWPNSPLLLVPTAGVGFGIIPTFVLFQMKWVSDYGNIHAEAGISVASDFGANYIQTTEAGLTPFETSHLLAAGFDSLAYLGPGNFNWYPNTNSNMPLLAGLDNHGAGNLTGGNPGNLLVVDTEYFIVGIP